MSTEPIEDDLDDLLPDDLAPKKGAVPLQRTPRQIKAATQKAAEKAAADALSNQAARLAQIVNLHIGGYSLAQIGVAIGASPEEVDRMLNEESARYVRNQPALRTYVRNFISEKYTGLLEAVYPQAIDTTHRAQLEHHDRAVRVLKEMANLHGAAAPTQTEVKVDAAPEAVERLVQAMSAANGLGYDMNVFDVPEEDIHEAHVQASEAVVVSGNALEAPQEGDPDDGF